MRGVALDRREGRVHGTEGWRHMHGAFKGVSVLSVCLLKGMAGFKGSST